MEGRILVAEHDGVYLMRFVGDVRVTLCMTADTFLDAMLTDKAFRSVVVDLSGAEGIDSTSLGILAKLSIQTQKRFGFVPTLISTNADITRILLSMGFEDVFHIVAESGLSEEHLGELAHRDAPREDVRRRVIQAHRTLMSLNETNREAFQDLVETLEAADGRC